MKKENINARLFASARKGKTISVKRLLDDEINVNATNEYGCTALMMAATNSHDDIVELLLDRGANINAQDCDGQTAFMDAVTTGTMAVIKLLLERGANVDIQDNDGMSALDYAKDFHHDAAIDLIESYLTARAESEFLHSVISDTNELTTGFAF